MTFSLPDLPYEYDALEPVIDEQTMRVHHSKHHAGYTKKLNAAIQDTDYEDKPITDILSALDEVDEDIRTTVRNNGGGYYNHLLFRENMAPQGVQASESMQKTIQEQFGSMEDFIEQFISTSAGQFGSGWGWLVYTKDKELQIVTTANQDNPISQGHTPLLGVDVREHAYYLHYQNKRADYLKARTQLINREVVEKRLQDAQSA